MDLTQPLNPAWPYGFDRTAISSASDLPHARPGDPEIDSLYSESRTLVHQIFLAQRPEPRAVVFAGIDHGNGCSHICAAVTDALARVTQRAVCLVEANFRSPGLVSIFGTANEKGLSDALVTAGPIKSFATPIVNDKLWLLSVGSLSNSSADLLTSERFALRLAELRAQFDFVIIDAPPLGPSADAIALGRLSDGLVVIIEADATRKQSALTIATTVRMSQVAILGAVLNNRKLPIPLKLYSRL